MALPMPLQLDQLDQLDMQEDLKLALMLGDQLPLVPIPLSPFYLANNLKSLPPEGQAASHLYTMILVDKLYYPLDPPVGDPAASPFVPRSDDPALANVLIT